MNPEGWYGLRLTQKSEVPSMRGSLLPETSPVLLAMYRAPAPYPDIQVALPLTDETARDWIRRDPETLQAVGYELAQALTEFMAEVRGGGDQVERALN
jgi:hypothetical protein